jgi:hypothetical protein
VTLHATRDGENITIHGNTGVHVLVENSHLAKASITEHAHHVRYFHAELGKLLDAAEGKTLADDAEGPQDTEADVEL